MRRIILFFLLLLPLAAPARKPAGGKAVPKAKITAAISEFRRYEGVEVVRLGRVGTAAVKTLMRAAAQDDPDAREALQLMRGVRNLAVLDYEGCAPAVREKIVRRLDQALDGSELLMEAKDGGSAMRMFGILDERADRVRDFVIHAPGDCSLICIFGSIPLDAVAKMASND